MAKTDETPKQTLEILLSILKDEFEKDPEGFQAKAKAIIDNAERAENEISEYKRILTRGII
jgi:hypothetical protein